MLRSVVNNNIFIGYKINPLQFIKEILITIIFIYFNKNYAFNLFGNVECVVTFVYLVI